MLNFILILGFISFSHSSTSIVISHRGAHNPFRATDLNCPTKRLLSTSLPWIENTLRSVKEAFDANADMVEVDLRITADDHVVVFHDEEVSCKTNGKGKVRELTLKQMKKLDLGFNFSGDNGRSFPFRSTGIGQLVTVKELLVAFPGKKFLFNFKDYGPKEALILGRTLASIDKHVDFSGFHFWGGFASYNLMKKGVPEFGSFFPVPYQMELCYKELRYLSWFGIIPISCHHKQLSFNLSERNLPFFMNIVRESLKFSEVALWQVNTRLDFIGHYGLVPIIISGAILKLGLPYTPYHPDYLNWGKH